MKVKQRCIQMCYRYKLWTVLNFLCMFAHILKILNNWNYVLIPATAWNDSGHPPSTSGGIYLQTESPQHHRDTLKWKVGLSTPKMLHQQGVREAAGEGGGETHYKINSYWHVWQNSSFLTGSIFLCLHMDLCGKQHVQTGHLQRFNKGVQFLGWLWSQEQKIL